MKKTLITVALAAMLGTSALAEDFDNTTIKLTAKTDDYSISIKDKKTGATEFHLRGDVGPIDTTVKWMRDGSVDNYALKGEKKQKLPTGPLYVGAHAELTFGDSYNTDTRTVDLEPYVGVEHAFGKVTPFAEVGYTWQSTTDDVIDFDRNSSYIEFGAKYALSEKVDMKLKVKEKRDVDFNNPGDMNAELGLTFKF
jgi:opacity protein-like surface antigen|tara:strand:- start:684 stop:1271 length:588 start_codon:yes stop_codon:yes gene_type:complete